MQIEKIISGAQTGADRAALDFAIEYEIDHGGWVPEGRRAEDGLIDGSYRVEELAGGGYVERTEQNVIDSDGTLIVSRGDLTGGSLLTREMAEKHAKPCLHVNIGEVIVFDASIDVYEWLRAHDIRVLNVAGPRASKDDRVYETVWNLLEMVLHIDAISGAMPNLSSADAGAVQAADREPALPQTVDEAVEMLLAQLTKKTKSRIAGRQDKALDDFENDLRRYIVEQSGLASGNPALLSACCQAAGKSDMDISAAALIIMQELGQRLREMGHLRVVK